MHSTLEQLNLIKNKVNDIIIKKQLKTNPNIIVVTKCPKNITQEEQHVVINKIKPYRNQKVYFSLENSILGISCSQI